MNQIRVLIAAHGEMHDFDQSGRCLESLLTSESDLKVTLSTELDSICESTLRKFDVLVLYAQEEHLSKKQMTALLAWVKKGKGLVGVHCASVSFPHNQAFGGLLGCRFLDHGPIHRFQVDPTETDHYITRRVPPFSIEDELYLLKDLTEDSRVLLTSNWKRKKHALLTVREEGQGRVAYLALGHDSRSLENPAFQTLLKRSVRWSFGAEEGEPIRCGLVGYGGAFNMGEAHGKMIEQTPGLELAAICDLDTVRLALAKETFPGIMTFQRYRRMLEREDLDLIVLVTPHNTHAHLAIEALSSGKHVITEKPMCITADEGKRMVSTAKRKKRMLSVFHNRRWDGDYTTLKNIIESGAIGEVFQVDVFSGGYEHPGWWWRSDKKISGGCLHDWGAHFIDWFLDLIPSQVIDVSGYFQKRYWHAVTNEDHALAILRFKNGVVATIEQSNLAAAPKDRWRVLGSKGAATWKGPGEEHWNVTSYQQSDQRSVSQVPFEKGDWQAYYRNVADHLTMGEDLVVKGDHGLRVISMIETAEKSSRAGNSLKPAIG